MRWTVHGERTIYDSAWVRLCLVDVEIPGRERFEHHVVRTPYSAAGTVVHDPDRGVLLLWRHRFLTDTWGWEVPAGMVEAGESPADAAVRETIEETGWRPGPLRPLTTYHPINGLCDEAFHLFLADGAEHLGDPTDPTEAARVEWLPVPALRQAVADGQLRDGLSLTAVCYALAFASLD